MDSARFDDLVRTLASSLPRRAMLAALATGLVGAGHLALLDGEVAGSKKKKKRKNKKKKKCKSGTKKCGKQCIPNRACCGACLGANPGGTSCGQDGDCGPQQNCVDGNCICSNPLAINCGALCCNSDSEVCKFGNSTPTCIPASGGSCPVSNFCNDSTFYACATGAQPHENCVCATTADSPPQNACVFFQYTQQPAANCTPCANSLDCPQGQFCILGNASGVSYCGCNNNFCVPFPLPT